MRIVGIKAGQGEVQVAALSDNGTEVTVLAPLAAFWADATGYVEKQPAGPTIAIADVQLVPPVLPDARVICIGLNYLKHIAEGSYSGDPLPEYPTLFARWTRSLTVDGAEVPVPANETGLDWEGEIVAYVGISLVDATPDEALASVVGYSTFNDLTSRRAQKLTSQWILGRTATTQVRSARWSPQPRSETCATGYGCRPGSTARPSRMAARTRWCTRSATPSR